MPINIDTTTENNRIILTVTGDGDSLDDIWLQIPRALKSGTVGNFFTLVGDISLVLKCRLTEDRTGVRVIVLRKGARLIVDPTASINLGKIELVDGVAERTGLVFVNSDEIVNIPTINSQLSSTLIPEMISGIFSTELEPGWTFARLLKLFAAVLGGKITPSTDKNVTKFRNISDTLDGVVSIADSDSNRSIITYNIPTTGVYSVNKNSALHSEEIVLPATLANTSVTVATTKIQTIQDIKYVFEASIRAFVRVLKAEISGSSVTFIFSADISTSKIIIIGNL